MIMETMEKSNKFHILLSFMDNKRNMNLNSYSSIRKDRKFLNFSILVFMLTFFISVSYGQESNPVDKIVDIKETTEKAIAELKQIIGNDKEKLKLVLNEISEREKLGVIILSTKEYQPIKDKMDEFYKNKSINGMNYNDSKVYIEKLYYKYTVVTDLIKL